MQRYCVPGRTPPLFSKTVCTVGDEIGGGVGVATSHTHQHITSSVSHILFYVDIDR